MNTKVYIDGQSGTTGLKIYDRIAARSDLEMLRIDEDKRHDVEERRKFLNKADIVFLCLPDDSAREAVELQLLTVQQMIGITVFLSFHRN